MGLEKVGTTIGKEIIAWTRTSGKSLLATRPVKINPSRLKYTPAQKKGTVQLLQSVGKHKIPRYIYHITSKHNYERMLESGTINLSHDPFFGKGIFFTDIQNLFKEWNKFDNNRGKNLLELLLHHCGHNDAVLLRIPSSKLNIENLFVRSQKRVFSAQKKIIQEYGEEEINRYSMKLLKTGKYEDSEQVLYDSILHFIKEKYGAETLNHLTNGDKAIFAKLYKQRKEAIEYIYKDKINISDVEKIGECPNTWSTQRIGEKCTPREIFESLLEGATEKNNLIYLNA